MCDEVNEEDAVHQVDKVDEVHQVHQVDPAHQVNKVDEVHQVHPLDPVHQNTRKLSKKKHGRTVGPSRKHQREKICNMHRSKDSQLSRRRFSLAKWSPRGRQNILFVGTIKKIVIALQCHFCGLCSRRGRIS